MCNTLCVTHIHVHVFSRDISIRDLTVPLLSLCYRYQYDSGKLQELISELDRVSFEMDTRKKSKRGKVGTWTVETPKTACMELIKIVSFQENKNCIQNS